MKSTASQPAETTPKSDSTNEQIAAAKQNWQTRLGGHLPILELPSDRPRTANQKFSAATVAHVLPVDLLQKADELCKQQNTSRSKLFLALFAALLHRYTGQQNFLIAQRIRSTDAADAPVNMVLVRADIDTNAAFIQLLAAVASDSRSALAHGKVPFEQLTAAIDGLKKGDPHKLYQVAFSDDNVRSQMTENAEVFLSVGENTGDTVLTFRYNSELFRVTTIERMAGHFETLLQSAVATPAVPVSRLELLTKAEKHQLLDVWNNTYVPFPEDACLHQLFEQCTAEAPDTIAIVFKDQQLSYGELNRRANKLAHYLLKLGIGPDVLVGVHMERSLEMVIGLYAIHKAGGAYVPMDPSYPASRLEFMLEDTRVPVLLTQRELAEKLPEFDGRVLTLDTIWETVAGESEHNPESGVTPEHLAYVIYTSGSTGRPKGAVLNHRGRVNNFCDFNRRYQIGPGDRLLGLASLSFDMSAYDIFGTLAAGGTTVVVEGPAVLEPPRWAEMMQHHEITIWHSVPALLEMLVDYYDFHPEMCSHALRLVLLGGDWIPVTLPDRLKEKIQTVHVVSMGGATECSMDSTIYDIEAPSSAWKSIPYGVPMAGQLSYVLDEWRQPLPIGMPGELFLGGIGVGRGYFNRPALTAEKFVPNPFTGLRGDRMYRTGDLARYGEDSNLELLGRIDFQVKIRGFRIELGEIISTLTQHADVKEAVVVAKEMEPGKVGKEKRLVAYVVPRQTAANGNLNGMNSAQVTQWQTVFEETYNQKSQQIDPTFNIIGWNSSYTGLPLAEEEMREWVDQSVQRILEHEPESVFEIACGTGLLLHRIAPHCKRYIGTDFSATALQQIWQHLRKPGCELPQVELFRKMADDFDDIDSDAFDCAILNSVIQHFPGIDYLVRVLEGTVKAVREGGVIYLGDLFNLALIEAFHTSIQLHQAPASLPISQLQQRIDRAVQHDERLFIDPAFFRVLPQHLPKIKHVQIQLRRATTRNEMALFRYDAVLQIGGHAAEQNDAVCRDWQTEKMTLDALKKELQASTVDAICWENIPNARLAKEVQAMELIANPTGIETAGELRAQLDSFCPEGAIDPEALWALADETAFSVRVSWSQSSKGCMRVELRRTRAHVNGQSQAVPAKPALSDDRKPWHAYSNNPLQGALLRELTPKLRTHVQKQLPDYMVPSAFVYLEALPLSPNGKIDRRALPVPDFSRPEILDSYEAPRTSVEQVVADIWAEVFEFEKIGIHDHFLEIGGHSLLAIQIMTRLQDIFPIELPLSYLFGSPTVAELARRIVETGNGVQIDVTAIARAVMEINQLSEEEVQSMLIAEATAN